MGSILGEWLSRASYTAYYKQDSIINIDTLFSQFCSDPSYCLYGFKNDSIFISLIAKDTTYPPQFTGKYYIVSDSIYLYNDSTTHQSIMLFDCHNDSLYLKTENQDKSESIDSKAVSITVCSKYLGHVPDSIWNKCSCWSMYNN
jgi:hypothetical protein